MNALLNLRYSVSNGGKDPSTPRKDMAVDPITQAVQEVQHASSGVGLWWNLGLAFLIGGGVSAIWIWREGGRRPNWKEIVSTALCSGAISAAFIAYLIGKNITLPMIICISILTGFSGEMIIRVVIRGFVEMVSGAMARLFGWHTKKPDTKEEKKE